MHRPAFMTPSAWDDFERLWCRTTMSAGAIEALIRDKHGLVLNARWTAERRGLVRLDSQNAHAAFERMQIAALNRWQAPRTQDNAVRKPQERYRVPEGGYRLGRTTQAPQAAQCASRTPQP